MSRNHRDVLGYLVLLAASFGARSASAGPFAFPLPPVLAPATPVIRAGSAHSCALMPNGSVKCWGSNNFGESALGYTGGIYSSPTTAPTLGGRVIDLSTNDYHSCAVLENFTVQCWGYNYYGQLGDGTTSNSGVARTVPGIWSATRVATGYGHSCALLSDGHVLCWGHNQYGQLGDGTFSSRTWPAFVSGLSDVVDIAASGDHMCARERSGLVSCWGEGSLGQLGSGYANSAYPLRVSGLTHAFQLALGEFHSCALRTGGYVSCWGLNSEGELGDGSYTFYRDTPTRVLLDSVTSVTAGTRWTCATTSELANNAYCWGGNTEGELGDGTTDERRLPNRVPLGQARVVSLSAGIMHTCAVLSNSSASCWGWNAEGQLGRGWVNPPYSPYSSYPWPVVSFP
jgi:alpha-tubulin suppressor-like RCC1 family protein